MPDELTLSNLKLSVLAGRIVERHRDRIKVKKTHVATENVARLVSSALRLSNKTGFHAMGMRDLSEDSGISIGAVYTCVASKSVLLDMILDAVAFAIEDILVNPMTRQSRGTPTERLMDLVYRHVELTEKMLPWFRFVHMEAKAFPAHAKERVWAHERLLEELLEGIVQDGRKTGTFHVGNVPATVMQIVWLMQGWYIRRAQFQDRGIDAQSFADALILFVLSALGVKQTVGRLPTL